MVKTVLIGLYDQESTGLRILHRCLKDRGHEVYTIFLKFIKKHGTNLPTKKEISLLVNKIKEIQPKIIGISLRSMYFRVAIELTKKIRDVSDAKIIYGGVHPTIEPIECLKFADMVCIGEGEQAIVELADKIEAGENFEKIKNIWLKTPKGIIKNEFAPFIKNLDSIPFPDYSDSQKYYIEDDKLSGRNFLPIHEIVYPIMTSRGCPFSCTFCQNNTFKKIFVNCGPIIRRRSPENVISELIWARKKWSTIAKIYFEDDVFSYDLEWLREFSKLYKKHINLLFYCYVHPSCVNENAIKLLKEIGLYEVNMGIQSGSERIRKEIYGRYETDAQIIETIKILNKYKIRVVCDLILSNPYEGEEDKRKCLELLLKLPKPIILLTYVLKYYPNCEMTKMALKDGFITKKDLESNNKISNQHWHGKFLSCFSRDEFFWNSLYYLASKNYPKRLVEKIYRSKLIRRYPTILVSSIKGIEEINFLVSSFPKSMNYIKRGQFRLLLKKIKSSV